MPVGADWYAVEMTSVREVVAQPQLAPVPTAPGSVLGLFNLRGEIVPLFDTAALLGIGRVEEPSYCAVVLTSAGPAGLAASGVPDAADLGEPIVSGELSASVGGYAVDDRLVTLLDVDLLVR